MANLRAAARRRPPPFPDVRLDDLSDWLRRRVDAHVIAMLKERDNRAADADAKKTALASAKSTSKGRL